MELKQRFESNRFYYLLLFSVLVFLEVFTAEALTRCGTPRSPAPVVCDNPYKAAFIAVPLLAFLVARLVNWLRDRPVKPPIIPDSR